MILTHLELRNFRSYPSLSLDFSEGANLILGPNGAGKTNLAEAIAYLSWPRSWRTNEEKDLIREKESNASILARVEEGPLKREILIELGPDGKKVFLNGKPLRKLTELNRTLNVLLFTPQDVAIFQGPPSERRSFMDLTLAKQSKDYLTLLLRQNRLLKQRNALLKSQSPDRALLEVLTNQLIEVQHPIVRYRTMFVESANAILPGVLASLRGEKAPCALSYRPFVKDDGSYQEKAKKAYSDALEGDLLHKSTSVGIHREDFSLKFQGKDISTQGSQGENRLCALALKLVPFFLVEEEAKKPICVLDDVLSELDPRNAERLLSYIGGLGQTFLTATHASLQGASIYEVADHKAIRR